MPDKELDPKYTDNSWDSTVWKQPNLKMSKKSGYLTKEDIYIWPINPWKDARYHQSLGKSKFNSKVPVHTHYDYYK